MRWCKSDGEPQLKLVGSAPDATENAEEDRVAGGGSSTESCMVCGGGVCDEAYMAEPTQSSLSDAVEQTIQLRLVLAFNPVRSEHRGQVTCVLVCANSKEGGVRSCVDKDGRKGKRK